ncbi:MAG: hypothetical protein IJR36_07830, partial [Lachnospiraceae bacterium]|nr:hypothetical protein [Lachnospiraceae bacterium]
MKKVIAILMIMTMVLGAAACAGPAKDETSTTAVEPKTTETTTASESTSEAASEGTEASSETPAAHSDVLVAFFPRPARRRAWQS